MKKHFSIIMLMIVIMSCRNTFKVEYYFPEKSVGFYAIIFNSKNGVTTQKSKGEYEYNFEKSNILFAKEPQLIGEGKSYYYLFNADKTIKKEIVAGNDFIPKNNQTIVYFHTLASYTNAETNKEVNYEALWLAPNKKLSATEQIEEDKRQNIQIQKLHRKIDSLVNIGIL